MQYISILMTHFFVSLDFAPATVDHQAPLLSGTCCDTEIVILGQLIRQTFGRSKAHLAAVATSMRPV